MDIEWGKDGETGKLYVLQARPETVQSRAGRTIQRYTLKQKGRVLATRSQHRPAHRRGAGAHRRATSGKWRASKRATCSSPT